MPCGQNLNIGQRQLISLGCVLLANPVILLLDETNANADSYSEHVLQQTFEHLLKGRTAVVIAHRLPTIRDAGRTGVLCKGRHRGIKPSWCNVEAVLLGGHLFERTMDVTMMVYRQPKTIWKRPPSLQDV